MEIDKGAFVQNLPTRSGRKFRASWHDPSDFEKKNIGHSEWFDTEFEADAYISRVRKFHQTFEFWVDTIETGGSE